MKIYNEVTIDMNPESNTYGKHLSEDVFDYDGEIIKLMPGHYQQQSTGTEQIWEPPSGDFYLGPDCYQDISCGCSDPTALNFGWNHYGDNNTCMSTFQCDFSTCGEGTGNCCADVGAPGLWSPFCFMQLDSCNNVCCVYDEPGCLDETACNFGCTDALHPGQLDTSESCEGEEPTSQGPNSCWYANPPCSCLDGRGALDVDNDGICDTIDDCVGSYDACGVCNGDGSSCMGENCGVQTYVYCDGVNSPVNGCSGATWADVAASCPPGDTACIEYGCELFAPTGGCFNCETMQQLIMEVNGDWYSCNELEGVGFNCQSCDCPEDDDWTGGGGWCAQCAIDHSAYGSECCDSAWYETGGAYNCETLENDYGWDCQCCNCPGDPDWDEPPCTDVVGCTDIHALNYCEDCIPCEGNHPVYGYNQGCCEYLFGPHGVVVMQGEYSEECGFEVDLAYCEETWGEGYENEDGECMVHPEDCGWGVGQYGAGSGVYPQTFWPHTDEYEIEFPESHFQPFDSCEEFCDWHSPGARPCGDFGLNDYEDFVGGWKLNIFGPGIPERDPWGSKYRTRQLPHQYGSSSGGWIQPTASWHRFENAQINCDQLCANIGEECYGDYWVTAGETQECSGDTCPSGYACYSHSRGVVELWGEKACDPLAHSDTYPEDGCWPIWAGGDDPTPCLGHTVNPMCYSHFVNHGGDGESWESHLREPFGDGRSVEWMHDCPEHLSGNNYVVWGDGPYDEWYKPVDHHIPSGTGSAVGYGYTGGACNWHMLGWNTGDQICCCGEKLNNVHNEPLPNRCSLTTLSCCCEPEIKGCSEPLACNYNPIASTEPYTNGYYNNYDCQMSVEYFEDTDGDGMPDLSRSCGYACVGIPNPNGFPTTIPVAGGRPCVTADAADPDPDPTCPCNWFDADGNPQQRDCAGNCCAGDVAGTCADGQNYPACIQVDLCGVCGGANDCLCCSIPCADNYAGGACAGTEIEDNTTCVITAQNCGQCCVESFENTVTGGCDFGGATGCYTGPAYTNTFANWGDQACCEKGCGGSGSSNEQQSGTVKDCSRFGLGLGDTCPTYSAHGTSAKWLCGASQASTLCTLCGTEYNANSQDNELCGVGADPDPSGNIWGLPIGQGSGCIDQWGNVSTNLPCIPQGASVGKCKSMNCAEWNSSYSSCKRVTTSTVETEAQWAGSSCQRWYLTNSWDCSGSDCDCYETNCDADGNWCDLVCPDCGDTDYGQGTCGFQIWQEDYSNTNASTWRPTRFCNPTGNMDMYVYDIEPSPNDLWENYAGCCV